MDLNELKKLSGIEVTESVEQIDEANKADTIRKSMPGFVGADFAKKASDEDILAMSDLKDKHAAVFNKSIKPIADEITKLRKKYKLKS